LLLEGNENQAVACARSLGRAGHDVVIGAHTSWSKAGWSRFASGTFLYPDPDGDAAAYVQSVVDTAARVPGTFVLPLTERATVPLSRERERLDAVGARYVLPAHEVVLRAFSKTETTRLAESLGIDVPRSRVISGNLPDPGNGTSVGLSFPLVLKPAASSEFSDDGKTRRTGRPSYARDAAELAERLAEMQRRASQVLIQEFVEGRGIGYFALLRHGELRAEFAHRRIRDVHPSGSGSSFRESIEIDAQLRKAGLSILQALGWHGVAMVEFRRRPDGRLTFLEVNGRFWGSLALAIHAGVDFPALLAELAATGDVARAPRYSTGVRCRWTLGDLRHLAAVMRGPPPGYPGEFPSRWRTLRDVLKPTPGVCHDNFALSDPLPELGDWLDFALHRVPRALGRAR
jgi:predicted ATP-grasp superfamily ATP-dependent carboligase